MTDSPDRIDHDLERVFGVEQCKKMVTTNKITGDRTIPIDCDIITDELIDELAKTIKTFNKDTGCKLQWFIDFEIKSVVIYSLKR